MPLQSVSTPTRTKRRLDFSTPRSSKKGRAAPRMRVPRSLLPEVKQYIRPALTNGPPGGTTASSLITTDMSQGDASNQFIGSKFRIKRIRVHYDFSDIASVTEGFRISVVLSKNASLAIPGLANSVSPWDTNQIRVLHDLQLSSALEHRAGTFDVTGPFLCTTNFAGTQPITNNIQVQARNFGKAADMATRMSYTVWYTDA